MMWMNRNSMEHVEPSEVSCVRGRWCSNKVCGDVY
jgi:hypothetical protein